MRKHDKTFWGRRLLLVIEQGFSEPKILFGSAIFNVDMTAEWKQ